MRILSGCWNLVAALTGLAACASPALAKNGAKGPPAPVRPLVVGHRGASGYLPEHTLEAYGLAIEMGADFVEPDLVATKDGVLICRHENEISGTTDVAEKFPNLKKRKMIDGASLEGWFTEDLTLAQIKTLRAKERLPFRSQESNGKFLVPTFEEVIDFIAAKSKEKGRVIGLFPETKHPSYFQSVGLPLEDRLLEMLRKYDLDSKEAPVVVQSFEVANLKEIRSKSSVRLAQLLEDPKQQPYDFVLAKDPRRYIDLVSPAGLKEVATYANGIAPNKRYLIPEDPQTKKLLPPTKLVEAAHAAGLQVVPWTFRSDASFLHAEYAGDPLKEYAAFYRLGVDAVFSDFADHAVRARDELFK